MDPLVPDKATGVTSHRCIVARIEYPGPERKTGLLIYVKPSFAGDEDADLLLYRLKNSQFPHDPTVNQWFNEDQVESYRELGYSIGRWVGEALETNLHPLKLNEIEKAVARDVKQHAADRVERLKKEISQTLEVLQTQLKDTPAISDEQGVGS